VLVTGPTGSGKSTTLYGALTTAYRPGIKIVTAEDPVEYVYEQITQCEVNPKIGNNFAKLIRAFLRQDPDIIMVGEIRDSETAEMAFRAAQTGHLVLSTLHTNDAISSVTRLLDIGVDASLVSSCILGVLAQRLVRRICTPCKSEYVPTDDVLSEFFNKPPQMKWYRGMGCSECNHTGYSGRMAIAELWIPNERDMILINKRANLDELYGSAAETTISMSEDAMDKLKEGQTNLEELIRTLPYPAIYSFREIADQLE
jgi:type IV pilus assembly protein PilB